MIVSYSCMVLVIYWLIFAGHFRTGAMRLAVSFIVAQFMAMALLLGALCARRFSARVREKRARRLYPIIRKKLAEYLLGDRQLSSLRHLRYGYPVEFEVCLVDFLPSIAGEGSRRLSQLAGSFGLVKKWEREARSTRLGIRRKAITQLCLLTSTTVRLTLIHALYDSDLDIRIEACCALIRLSHPEEINQIFNYAITQPLAVRSILIEELRPHALLLARGAIHEALRADDASRVISTLAVIEAWRRALPLPDVENLLSSPDSKVCTAAFRVLPYVASDLDPVQPVSDGLASKDPLVKIAAARASGRLKIEAVVPTLVLLLRNPNKEVARASACALGEMGASGMQILEDHAHSTDQIAAKAALEALECMKGGRHGYAGLS